MEETFKLPIGYKYEGKEVMELSIANTGSEAEEIYTKKPPSSKLHTWFGKVIATSVKTIGDEVIASKYNKQEDKDMIPPAVKAIPFIDAGTVLIQIQRECWEDTLPNQKLSCINCGEALEASVDLNRIDIPTPKENPTEFYDIDLSRTYEITDMVDEMKEYEGHRFNAIRFRVATLGDAIKHEAIAKDEILLWRRLAFDTMTDLLYKEDGEVIHSVPSGYITKRGTKLFNSDFNSKTLKEIRSGMQKTLPSAKYYYEEDCPKCNRPTPFFASVTNFFST